MANLKASKKAIRSQARKRTYNLRRLKAYREAQKEVKEAVAANDKKKAQELLPKAYKKIDKAAKGNAISKNAAGRYKSRLAKLVEAVAGSKKAPIAKKTTKTKK